MPVIVRGWGGILVQQETVSGLQVKQERDAHVHHQGAEENTKRAVGLTQLQVSFTCSLPYVGCQAASWACPGAQTSAARRPGCGGSCCGGVE